MMMMVMMMITVVALNPVEICVYVVMIVMANATVVSHVTASAAVTASAYIAHDAAAGQAAYGRCSAIAAAQWVASVVVGVNRRRAIAVTVVGCVAADCASYGRSWTLLVVVLDEWYIVEQVTASAASIVVGQELWWRCCWLL